MNKKVNDTEELEDDSDKQLVPVSQPFSMEESSSGNKDDETVAKQLELELIKSSAVVKYGLYSYPLQFLKLHSNTNLNKPPSNWLRSSSPMERYIRQMAQPKQRSPYASFQMGSSNLDEVGKMDVISDSENIKNLMKLPYSKTQPVSMMVHRIGKTLFLDDFDVQKNLLRQQQEDWKWLKKFYQETVVQNQNEEHEEGSPRPLKGRNVLQSRNMFSKFLYYSVEANQETELQPEPELEAPELEAPKPAPEPSDTPSAKTDPSSEFTRTVQWTFEDIRMLIGTDLPIFGGGTHPCVSLRLRDMRQPISVLTGLDYWLDNLMCNVPELAMCYHLDGIVQNYELVSTNDIPSMEDSKFSPSVIRDVAQNMLSFLKTNVTKEGHTYWLFKGHNDDIIKLYDLTTLCSDDWETNSENPFTVPVGILLFRVARNIMNVYGREKSGTIRTLLKNCLALLDPNTHAQVVATACFMLADLYVKNDLCDQDLPKEREEVEEEEEEEEEKEWEEKEGKTRPGPMVENQSEISLPVTSLCLSEKKPSGYLDVVGYAPMSGDVEERCQEALQIIVQGLTCVDRSIDSNDSQSEATQCPDEPIPLGYEKLRPTGLGGNTSPDQETGCDDCSKNRATVLSPMRTRRVLRPWQEKYRLSLLHKAVYTFYWLGDVRAKSCKYGLSLRCMRNALICFHAVTAGSPLGANGNHKVLSALLTLCGDVHMMLAREQCMQVHEDLYGLVSDSDKIIMSHAVETASVRSWDPVQEEVGLMTRKATVHLSRANAAYSRVVELLDVETVTATSDGSGAVRRYGSSHNELGVMNMNELAQIYAESTDYESDLIIQHESMWSQCLAHFHAAIESFERIDDSTNIGLVHSNIARLMRVLAQGAIVYTNHERGEFSGTEKNYFLKAVDSYRSALATLSSRDQCPAVWDSVRWELSSSYFNLATLLQDYAPLSSSTQSEIEKEVTAFMDKALKYCDTETETSRLPSCQYRAATIHHRLASLYHNSFRNQSLEHKKKHLRMLAELHYEKACRYFQILESACELFRVTLERVAMCEFCLAGQTSPTNKMRSARQSLSYLLQCKAPLTLIRNQSMESNSGFEVYMEESLKLSGIFVSRLQFTMLTLVKLTKSMKKSNTNESAILKLKQMYARSLQKFGTSSEDAESLESARDMADCLIEVLDAINSDWTVIETIGSSD